MKRRLWKFALVLLVPLALYAYIAERNSWRPKTLLSTTGAISLLKFSQDGSYLAVEQDSEVFLIEVSSRQIIKKIQTEIKTISLSELPPGNYLVKVYSDDNELLSTAKIIRGLTD